MAFYFLTFATAAWGYALLAWLGDILRKEPEVRSILVAIAITLTYVGHATIPLRAWRVSDSPRYPIGFPLAAAFSAGSIMAILGILWYVRRYPQVMSWGLDPIKDTAVEEEIIPRNDDDDRKRPDERSSQL